ncbi:GPR25 protein, partial [Urocolius indicus]|nr:GPR25 protein [Urocolius indicus]
TSADYDYVAVPNGTDSPWPTSSQELVFTTIFIPTFYSFIFLLGLSGNVFVIVLTAKRSQGRRAVYTFVLNLAVADVLLVLLLPLCVAVGARGQRWPLGEGLCKLSSYVVAVNRCSSVFFLTALSVERYLVIRKVLDTKVAAPRRRILIA